MSARNASPEVITLGCRLNSFESEAMRKAAEAAGHDDLVIVNTCAVTAEAVSQARQTIRRLNRENPDRRIVVTGCAAQTEPETFAAMPEVAQIIGNDIKLKPETWAGLVPAFGLESAERVIVNDIMSVTETAGHLVDGFQGRVRAFVQVQNGCDHRCTFCIIPFGRGNSRSVAMGEVVAQVQRLVEAGYHEVVLTGVDLTSYGADLPHAQGFGRPTLGALVKAILDHVQGLARLRISSIDSIEADETLVRLLKEERRLMPHLHLSLQAGDNLTLKRMKRRHSREDAIRFCAELRAARPDFVFGADIIAGFPTETETMFESSLRLIEECGLTFLHVFPYSPRPGTPAARMPQVEKPVIKTRAARLREASAEALRRHLQSRIGFSGTLLVEHPAKDGRSIGRLDDFTPVRFEGSAEPGSLAFVEITGHEGTALVGRLRPGVRAIAAE